MYLWLFQRFYLCFEFMLGLSLDLSAGRRNKTHNSCLSVYVCLHVILNQILQHHNYQNGKIFLGINYSTLHHALHMGTSLNFIVNQVTAHERYKKTEHLRLFVPQQDSQ